MNPPSVYEVTNPNSHSTSRITKIVQSIRFPFPLVAGGATLPAQIARPATKADGLPMSCFSRTCGNKKTAPENRSGTITQSGVQDCKEGKETVLADPKFHAGRYDRLLLLKRTALRSEFVALDCYRGALFITPNHTAVDHELHGTSLIQKHGPVHRQLHRHADRQRVFRREPHAAAADVQGLSGPRLSDALTV